MNSEEIVGTRVINDTKMSLVAVDTYGVADYRDYRIDVTSNDFSYQVSGPNQIEMIILIMRLPPATAEMDGARLSAYELTSETSQCEPGYYFFADQPEHPHFAENAVYKLENLLSGVAENNLYHPDFRAVAIPESHWDEKVTAVLGKIQTVYAYDATEAVHLAEITPSYALTFMKNVCERPFTDAKGEADIEKVFNSIGYDYEIDFENDDGGERITYMHCRNVARMQSVALPTDIAFQFEYMFAEDPGERLKMFSDLCADLEGNGWFSNVATFENRRTDAEILAAAEQPENAPETGMSR